MDECMGLVTDEVVGFFSEGEAIERTFCNGQLSKSGR